MSETYNDPIVRKLHETRHAILERHGNDFDAYANSVSKRHIPGVRYVVAGSYANHTPQKSFYHTVSPLNNPKGTQS